MTSRVSQSPNGEHSSVNPYPAMVNAHEVYTVEELARHLRWRKHSLRQAKRLGMPVIRFGSRDYAIGQQVLEWFEGLGQQRNQDPP